LSYSFFFLSDFPRKYQKEHFIGLYLNARNQLIYQETISITEPSEEDLQITKRLIKAGKLLGIEIVDHLIIAGRRLLSFKEKGLI